jgi:hypothetical protein
MDVPKPYFVSDFIPTLYIYIYEMICLQKKQKKEKNGKNRKKYKKKKKEKCTAQVAAPFQF